MLSKTGVVKLTISKVKIIYFYVIHLNSHNIKMIFAFARTDVKDKYLLPAAELFRSDFLLFIALN